MAALTGQKPAETYKDLLQLSHSGLGLDATLRPLYDGAGTASVFSLSTQGMGLGVTLPVIGVNGQGVFALSLGTAPTTSPADTVQVYASDVAPGATAFFVQGEGADAAVLLGRLTVRAVGGIIGTEEVQLSHDGTGGILENKEGTLSLVAATGLVRVLGASSTPGGLSFLARTPAQITADTDNYSPGVGQYQRWSSDADRTLTGLVAGVDGEVREVWNVGSFTILLSHESSNSTAANRFHNPGGVDLPLPAGEKTQLVYDGVTARWRVSLPLTGSFQPLDADLTAIAALSTTSYGRSLLTLADASALTGQVTGLNLTSQVSGVLPLANGGTNSSSLTPSRMLYSNGTSILSTSIITYADSGIYLAPSSGNSAINISYNTSAYSFTQTITAAGFGGIRLLNDQTRGLYLLGAGSTYPSALLSSAITGEAGGISYSGNFPLIFGTNNTQRMMISGAGLVSIGNLSPGAQLHTTCGSSSTKGLIVQGAASQTANLAEFQNSSGTAYVTVGPPTLTGTSTTSNWLNITGTLPSTRTAVTNAINCQITTAGSSSFAIIGHNFNLLAGYTGSSNTVAGSFTNANAGTGAALGGGDGNIGVQGVTSATTTGINFGGIGIASGGSYSAGLFGRAITDKASANNIGVAGFGLNAGASGKQVGGYFGLHGIFNPTIISAALICDNSDQTDPIFIARDNGTEKFVIEDGGTIDISGIAAATTNFRVTATSDTPTTTWGAAAGNEVSTTPAGWLKLDVGGNARYIPFWA